MTRNQKTFRKLLLGAAASGALLAGDGASATDAVGVKLSFESLHALKLTNEKTLWGDVRDEIYIRVIGRTPHGDAIDVRLPSTSISDDYIPMKTGTVRTAADLGSFVNQDYFLVQPPQIWAGVLPEDGDRAEFLVIVQEQDNATLGKAKETAKVIFEACEIVANGTAEITKDETARKIAEGCKVAKEASKLLPDNDPHEFVGAFFVQAMNVGGEAQVTFLPANSEMTGGSEAVTKLLNVTPGALGLVALDSALSGNRAVFDMRDNESVGHYQATVVAKSIPATEVKAGYYRLNADDVERGTCRGGKPVSVKLPNGSYRPIAVGETIALGPDGNRDIEYRCGGSFERERRLFNKVYDAYLPQRTRDKLNYYPFEFVHYTPSIKWEDEGVAFAAAKSPDFAVPSGVRKTELFLTAAMPKAAPTAPTTCPEIKSHDWSREPVRPMVNWWSARRRDNAAMVDDAWLGCRGDIKGSYGFHRIDGFVFAADRAQPKGTVPIYHWYNAMTQDNLLTAHPWFSDPKVSQRGGWKRVKLAGYIYGPDTEPHANLVPLYSWFSGPRMDSHTTTHPHWNPGENHKSTGSYFNYSFDGYLLRNP